MAPCFLGMCSFFVSLILLLLVVYIRRIGHALRKTREMTRPQNMRPLSSAPPSSRLRNVFRNGAAENPGEHVRILRFSFRLLVVAPKELELDQTVQLPENPQGRLPKPRLQAESAISRVIARRRARSDFGMEAPRPVRVYDRPHFCILSRVSCLRVSRFPCFSRSRF